MNLSGELSGYRSNSYVSSVGEAINLLSGTLNHTEWDSASNDEKMAALIHAVQINDNYAPYDGERYDEYQSLQFPRADSYDSDGELIIPPDVKVAQVVQAAYLLRIGSYKRLDQRNQGVGSVRIGQYWAFLTGHSFQICYDAAMLLMKYLDYTGQTYVPGNFLPQG